MDYLCALDAGTTGVRALAVDKAGSVIAQHYREITQYFPEPGWVEHDAVEITDAIVEVTGDLIAELGSNPQAIGITNQRETVVVWDRSTGVPVHRAIVWQDRRGADRCASLTAEQSGLIRATTGLIPDPYFSATKLEWLFSNVEAQPDRDLAVGTIDTWLIWCLTGGRVHATEPSNAARTMLFDIATLSWSPRLCELFQVPRDCLPDVRASSGRFGVTAQCGKIPAGIAISGVAGDQQSSLFGHGCFAPGMAKNTYGTGSFVLLNVGETPPTPPDGLLATIAWQLDGSAPVYALEGSIFSTGSAVQWLRDGLGIIESADQLEALARQCPDTAGVTLVPAFTGLGSPWWDPEARGTILGITRGTGRAEIARSVIEAMVFQTRDVIDAMSSDVEVNELRIDGGAAAMDLLCAMQADQLGRTVVRAATLETTALGAAFLAGLAEGFWSGIDEIDSLVDAGEQFVPGADRDDLAFERWHRALARSRGSFKR